MFNPSVSTANAKIGQRNLPIEFLFLDLESCGRCGGTEQNLETAVQIVAAALAATNTTITLEKIHIESAAQAQAHHLVTSPTIRINGRDIVFEMQENHCEDCSDLSGTETQCRAWAYEGELHSEAPVGLLVEALLREAVAAGPAPNSTPAETALPANLEAFFAGKQTQATACCSSAQQQSCCEPAAKASCCGTTAAAGSCGCQ